MGACATKPKVLLSERDIAPEQPKENIIVKEKEVVVEDVVKMEGGGDALKDAVDKVAEEKAVEVDTEVVPAAEDACENGKPQSLSTLFQEDKAGKKEDTEKLKTETEVIKSDEPVKEVEETKADETLAVATAAEIVKEHTPIEAEDAPAPTTVVESNDEVVSSAKTVVVEVPKDDKPQEKEAVTSPTSLMRKPFEFIENFVGKKEEHVDASAATEVQSPKSPKSPKVETLVQSPKSPKIEDAVQSPKSPKVEEAVSIAVYNLKQEPAVEAELPVVKEDSGKFSEAEPSK